MFIHSLYLFAGLGLVLSFMKSKQKTMQALKKAWKSFENILPQFLSIFILIGIMLSLLDTDNITKLLGADTGLLGVFGASIIGSITLIPGFVAFPLAAALLQNGAGVTQIAAFVSTLMMVGLLTLPLEIKTFGKKVAFIRNALAFFFSLFVAFIMGVLL